MSPRTLSRTPALPVSFLAAAMLLLVVAVAAQGQGPAAAPAPVTAPPALALPGPLDPPAAGPRPLVWQSLSGAAGRLPHLPQHAGSPLGWGGPSAFGYAYADSDEPWGPSPVFEDISAVGTPVTFSASYQPVDLPFAFPFYGAAYTQTYLYRDCSGCYTNPTHIAFLDPPGAVAWMGYTDRTSGAVYIYADPLADPPRFIIQYDDVFDYFRGAATTSQVILYQNGDILVRYAQDFGSWPYWYPTWPMPYLWNPALETFYHNGFPRSNFALQFTYPQGAWFWPPERRGASPAGSQLAYTFQLHNSTGLTDTFTLTSGGWEWPTVVRPAVTDPVADGQSVTVAVTVSIPAAALPGDMDGGLIEAASTSFPGLYTATAAISTTAVCSPLLTFSGQSGLATSHHDAYDYAGQRFTYLYAAAHSTGGTSTLTAQLQAYDPGLGQWQTLGSWSNAGPDLVLVDQVFAPALYSAVRVDLENANAYELYYDYLFVICREPLAPLAPPAQQSLAHAGATVVYPLTLTNYVMITRHL